MNVWVISGEPFPEVMVWLPYADVFLLTWSHRYIDVEMGGTSEVFESPFLILQMRKPRRRGARDLGRREWGLDSRSTASR